MKVVPPISDAASDNIVAWARGWRNRGWWDTRKGNHGNTRASPGRPLSRWEDVLVASAGPNWFAEAARCPKAWLAKTDEFFLFASGTKKIKALNIPMVVAPQASEDEQKEKPPPLFFPWQVVHSHSEMRLEFVGDSLVIANWMNGCWPVNNDRYIDTVNECVNLLQTFTKRHIAPRKRHTQWVRHVLRGYNEEADELATLGKNLLMIDCHLEVNWIDIASAKCVRGFWDGGYSQGSDTVGVGFVLKYSMSHPTTTTEWKVWCKGSWQMLWRKCHRRRTPSISLLDHMFFQTSDTQHCWDPLPPWS